MSPEEALRDQLRRRERADRLLGLVQQALKHCNGTHGLADIRRELEARRLRLWIAEDVRAMAITEIIEYPAGRVMNVFLSAGEIEPMRACLPGLEACARGENCIAVMFYGRAPRKAAWGELLPGYRPAWVCMWKDLYR